VSDVTHKADPGSASGFPSPGVGVSSRRVVEQLDEAACLELLSTGRIGRLIYNSRYGPVAHFIRVVPVSIAGQRLRSA
jgi:hypothetical protein